jgi:hypothetical protein
MIFFLPSLPDSHMRMTSIFVSVTAKSYNYISTSEYTFAHLIAVFPRILATFLEFPFIEW